MMGRLLKMILTASSKSCYGRTEIQGRMETHAEKKMCTPYKHGYDTNVFSPSQGYDQKSSAQIELTTPRFSGNTARCMTENRECLITDSCMFTGDMRRPR